MTKVRDFMRPGVLTCRKDTRIGQVAVMLDQHKVHSLMVTDRDGRIIGVITDFDLLAGEWLSQDPESLEVMKSLTAGDLMSSPVASIDANASIKEAAERMIKEVIRRLLVTDQGKPVGGYFGLGHCGTYCPIGAPRTRAGWGCDVGCLFGLP